MKMSFPCAAGVLAFFACLASGNAALAQDDGQQGAPEPYKVPKGEQPVFGKKYYPNNPLGNPDDRNGNMFLEINPAIILKRGVGVEFESRLNDRVTLGADFLFTSSKSTQGGVKADSLYAGLAPKVRLYPMEYLSGVFFGFKMYMGFVKWSLDTGSGAGAVSIDKSSVMLAPCAHLGYRFINWGNFTFAVYGGGGVNLPLPDFDEGLTEKERQAIATADEAGNWDRAVKDLKDEYSFRPDFGVTLGIVF